MDKKYYTFKDLKIAYEDHIRYNYWPDNNGITASTFSDGCRKSGDAVLGVYSANSKR